MESINFLLIKPPPLKNLRLPHTLPVSLPLLDHVILLDLNHFRSVTRRCLVIHLRKRVPRLMALFRAETANIPLTLLTGEQKLRNSPSLLSAKVFGALCSGAREIGRIEISVGGVNVHGVASISVFGVVVFTKIRPTSMPTQQHFLTQWMVTALFLRKIVFFGSD